MHPRTRSRSSFPVFLASVALIACGGGDDDGTAPDAGVSPQCQEATNHSDLEWIQDNIFSPSCAAFGSCHRGAAAVANGLNLETGNSEANMVNVQSMEDPNFDLVVPGDADNSYLLAVMGRQPQPPGVVINRTMPLGNPLLCTEKIEAVARWVDSL